MTILIVPNNNFSTKK